MKSILSIFLAVTLSLVVSIVIFPAYPVMAQGTIQAAIDAASPGDTIYVSQGTYNENLNITKPLTLTGEDRDTTNITAQNPGLPTISITSQNVTISNLTIRNDGIDGVSVRACDNISLINNNIYSGYHEGVYIMNSSGINLVDNNIQSNGTSGWAVGIWSEKSSEINIAGNNIHDSRSGIVFVETSNSMISNNTISNNLQHGISLSSSNGNTITGNTIYNNGNGEDGGYGIFVVLSENNEVYNNNFIDNWAQAGTSLDCNGTVFNLAKPIGGNYWDNWTEPDDDEDGFVDDPYEFGGGVDDLPWVLQDGWKEIPTTVDATVDIKPDTLNLNTKGKWITCYIELEEGYKVADIDVFTVKLNETVPAEENPAKISDYDEDGIPDLMVKFDRTSVQKILEVGDEVEIVITGELTDGPSFEGTDTIKVIDKSND